MGQCKERVCSWWPSSSSRIIVLVIIPLFVALVSVAAVMGGIDWIFASYYSWQWRSCTCLPPPPPPASSSQSIDIEEPKYNNIEEDLESARAAIREARNDEEDDDKIHDPDYIPRGPIYLNATAFHRSYLEMEKKFKVFVYEQGDPPVFHFGPRKGLYSVEGLFIQNMETSRFRTGDPEQAHAYFLPFSVTMMTQVVYMDDDWIPMIDIAKHYVNAVSRKYRFWNRSLGADHFMLACHDWHEQFPSS
ncbi:probable glycosyltransferase At5g03795 [Diospyros lotus]|uniref:probable glycosyltransferase At5g03795 n=1 Tax=Diospyros lotus TaxID=55363 RepID=UPI0022521E44|nr:probable glycosyltransferase At5g03795 [Diospyros lotus]